MQYPQKMPKHIAKTKVSSIIMVHPLKLQYKRGLDKKQAYKDIIMALVRGSNPIWFEVDLTAHAFDDTFYMFVLDNEIPYGPLPTWQDPFGNVVWDNPIRFLANGTLPNNIYFDPDTVYRLEFRQGPTQSDPLIYLVENYVPGSSGTTPINETSFSTDNQISNPQFALVNFISPLTLNSISTQVINVAPNWFLHLTGTGNVTLTQVLLNSSVIDPTNASYALQIQLSGSWTNAYLSQRFNQNGVLWSNTYVSSTITALSGNAPQSISATLVDSQGHTLTDVLNSTPLTAVFNAYPGIGQILSSSNTDFPPSAYIEYQLALPNNCNITITSVQLISSDINFEYPYEQTTIERQIDHLYHYYNLPLQFKPIPSFLVGWDFGLNPAQLGVSFAPSASASIPTWDQTILFSSLASNLSVTRASSDGRGAYQISCANAPTQSATIQYIDVPKLYDILTNDLSVNVEAFTNGVTTLGANISIWVTANANLPSLGSGNSLVTTLDANGHPSAVASGWVEITRANLSNANFIIGPSTGQEFNSYSFNGWNAANNTSSNALIDTAQFAAIVVGTAPIGVGNTVLFNSISLVPGKIATRPAPQAYDEVIRECERYYEKSYENADVAGTVQGQNSLLSLQNGTISGGNVVLFTLPFNINWRTVKRTTPSVNLFSPDTGSGDTVRGHVWTNGVERNVGDISLSGNWTLGAVPTAVGTKNIYFVPKNGTSYIGTASVSTTNPFAYVAYHYVADARLGLV
jgi:hypothetical protein